MDHALRTISYIADIGDLVVLMARRMSQSASDEETVTERLIFRIKVKVLSGILLTFRCRREAEQWRSFRRCLFRLHILRNKRMC